MNPTKILFLYSEIAAYFLACVRALSENNDVEVHIIKWPVNKEAPFLFQIPDGIKIYERNNYNDEELNQLVHEISPDKIICSGWMDKGYLKICKNYFGKIPTVLTLDNHWRGDFKQQMARIISPYLLKNRYSHVWVPGQPQYQFAKKLGFAEERIKTGFYSADVSLFTAFYHQKKNKELKLPKIFLYVGRYVKHKGIFDMWEAFVELQNEEPNNWELWCVGTGDQFENRILHEKIKHFGFIQPQDMGEIIQKSGVYVLPSHFEPWGVTVHEFAAAGFPLLCSNKVGSSELFLNNQRNGYKFDSGNKEQIKRGFKNIINKSEDELLVMQQESLKLSQLITPEKWTFTLLSFNDE